MTDAGYDGPRYDPMFDGPPPDQPPQQPDPRALADEITDTLGDQERLPPGRGRADDRPDRPATDREGPVSDEEPRILRDIRRAAELIKRTPYLSMPVHPAYAMMLQIREANPDRTVVIVAHPDLRERINDLPLPSWARLYFSPHVPAGKAYAFPDPESHLNDE